MAELNDVVTQKGALVGDEAVQAAGQKPTVTVNDEAVDAQVAGQNEPVGNKVNVSETSVQLDHVVTDPSSPEAVQIPDVGRGDLDLPINLLTGPTAEEVFAKEAGSSKPSPAPKKPE